jgi:phosphatidylglycerophosphatase A
MKNLIKILASGFGAGYIPVASGTFGSAVGLLIYLFFLGKNPLLMLSGTLFIIAVSVPISTAAENIYGKKDDSKIVIDEIAGFLVSVLFLPVSIKIAVIGFILFRIFDVVKPFFRKVQSLPGGWGIVIDDLLAGLLTNLSIRVLLAAKAITPF